MSLRWRIAMWYALLLAAAMVALGLTITLRVQAILYNQAAARLNRTMTEIVRTTLPPPNTFVIEDTSGAPLEILTNGNNLGRWASPDTYIQVDTPKGYPLNKSDNMGSMSFPPAPGLSPKHSAVAPHVVQTAKGPFLIEERLLASGRQAVVVQVGEPLERLYRAFSQTQRAIALILAVAVVAVAALSIALASQATNPIDELARAMREIGSDRLDRRLKWKNRQDEIGRLAETFDDLLGRLEEAFARERQFIADASHELKTPLTAINANAQMLARWGDADERVRRESLLAIASESASLANMVSGMLTLAKADSGDGIAKEPISLASLAADAVRGASQRAAEKQISLECECRGERPMISGDPNLIRQLVANLIDNAIKFTQRGGVTVRVSATPAEGTIEVRDTGMGIDPEELPLVFDRFYRTDKSRNRAIPGTGLGLAIVRSIARVHGGRVEAEAIPGGGTLFRATFPRIDDAAG